MNSNQHQAMTDLLRDALSALDSADSPEAVAEASIRLDVLNEVSRMLLAAE